MDDSRINFEQVVEFAGDIIIITRAFPLDDPGPEIVYVNRAFTALTGYSAEEVLGRSPRLLQSAKTDPDTTARIRTALERREPITETVHNVGKDGQAYWLEMNIIPLHDSEGRLTHFAAIERDVTEMVENRQRLQELLKTDDLTNVDNRRAFEQAANNEYYRYRRHACPFSILMLDVDHFKAVNDQHGHAVGDAVLVDLAGCCRDSLRQHDTFARIGGEEFAVLLPHTEAEGAGKIAERMRALVERRKVSTDAGALSVTVSIGVAEISDSDEGFSDTLRRADEALYKAKRNGRNRVCR